MNTIQQPIISIIIPTFNRYELLPLAVESFINQEVDKSIFEIIVVDNNSTDNTKQIKIDFPEIIYIFEPIAGTSQTRNTGAKHAKGIYLGFVDDDAIADKNFVNQALNTINSFQPDAFGGMIKPFYQSPKPDWFKDEYETWIHNPESGWIPKDTNTYLSGLNTFVKKNVFDEIGGFDVKLGPKAYDFSYGEDVEIVMRLLNANKKIYYNKELIVSHFVPEYKMNMFFLLYRYLEFGRVNFHQYKSSKRINLQEYTPESTLTEMWQHFDKVLNESKLIYNRLKSGEKIENFENLIQDSLSNLLIPIGFTYEQYRFQSTVKKNIFSIIANLSLQKIIFYIKKKLKSNS